MSQEKKEEHEHMSHEHSAHEHGGSKEEHTQHHEHLHKPEHSKEKKFNIQTVLIILLAVLVTVSVINLFIASGLNKEIKKNVKMKNEELKPAKIEIVSLKNSKCNDCSDISAILSGVKSLNVNITKERKVEFDSKEGKEIIAKYKIEKIPNAVITGEISKISAPGFEKKDDALLLGKVSPPFTNAMSGKVVGRVTLYSLKDPECERCNNLLVFMNQVKATGVKLYDEKTVSSKSDEGKQIIEKYKIGFVPTIVLSKDAGEYDIVKQAWGQVGSKEDDGSYVLRQLNPPFINLTTGKLEGIVNLIYLTDKSCKDCYNVSLHRNILTSPQSFAMTLDKEESYDIADDKGKELALKYNITKVPTIILSKEVSVYPSNQILKQFFTIQKDGSYVFTRLSSVGTYNDLSTGQVVKPNAAAQEQQN